MSLSSIVDALVASGCTAEQIAAAVKAEAAERAASEEARLAAKREGNRKRQAKRRAGHASNAMSHDVTPVTRDPPIDNTLTPSGGVSVSAREVDRLADEFYAAYPKHVDPKDAKARFVRFVRGGVDPGEIISATKRYAAAHLSAGTDKQFIPAPAVWLNRGGYLSEDLPQPRAGPPASFVSQSQSNGGLSNGKNRSASAAAYALKERLKLAREQRDAGQELFS